MTSLSATIWPGKYCGCGSSHFSGRGQVLHSGCNIMGFFSMSTKFVEVTLGD
ncbi:MAG: hypothetical protein IPH22_13355 [Nitrosomonas sp.]|nr:hypothetical protein [Nitrosomonas sp.]